MSFWEDKKAVHDLYVAAFDVPPETLAYLDITTGLIRINQTEAEFQTNWQQIDSESIVGNDFLETLHHEGTHFLQVVNCGYLYFLASRLLEIVKRSITHMLDTKAPEPIVSPTLAPDLRALFDHLDAPGPAQITPRTIVESATFHTQKRYWNTELDAKDYAWILEDECPSRVYRDAYDVAVEIIGDSAFGSFQYISYRALCSRNPAKSFVAICKEIALRKLRLDSYDRVSSRCPDDIMPFVAAADKAVGADHVGGPGHLLQMMRDRIQPHPVYTDAVMDFLHEQSKDPSLDSYVIAPHLATNDFALILRQPLVFNQTDPTSREWHIRLDRSKQTGTTDHYQGLMVASAIASKLVGQVFGVGCEPTSQPLLPPESIASAAGWNIVTKVSIDQDSEISEQLSAIHYRVMSSKLAERNETWGTNERIAPNPELLKYLFESLDDQPGGFLINAAFPLSPSRVLLVEKGSESVLKAHWIPCEPGKPNSVLAAIEETMTIPESDAFVLILSGTDPEEERWELQNGDTVSGLRASIPPDRPLVIMECHHDEIGGNYYVEQANLHLALAFLRKFHRNEIAIRKGGHDAKQLLDQALEDLNHERFSNAITRLSVLIEDPFVPPDVRERALYERAGGYRRSGEHKLAESDCSTLLQSAPVNPKLHRSAIYDRGTTRIAAGNFKGAIDDYTSALDSGQLSDNELAKTYMNRSYAFTAIGQMKNAMADLDRLLKLPNPPVDQVYRALLNQAECYRSLDQNDKAIGVLKRALSMQREGLPSTPDRNDILFLLADTYEKAKNAKEALRCLDDLIAGRDATSIQRAEALLSRAQMRMTHGDRLNAEMDLRTVLQMRALPDEYAERANKLLH